MPILASVCWEAGFVWLCGGWVCGIPRVVAWWCCGVLRVLAWSVLGPRWLRARVCSWVWLGGPRTGVRGPPRGGVLWRFPTLPHPLGCSTIGAAGLSFQVRYVAGRFPGAVTTTRLCRPPCWPAVWCGGVGGGLVVVRIVVAAPPGLVPRARCGPAGRRGLSWCRCPPGWWWGGWCGVGPLVPVGSRAPRGASTSGLSTRCSGGGLSPRVGAWKPHLGAGFPLRCFQRLSFPNVANQPCTWRYNWHTRGSSIPVLSY